MQLDMDYLMQSQKQQIQLEFELLDHQLQNHSLKVNKPQDHSEFAFKVPIYKKIKNIIN